MDPQNPYAAPAAVAPELHRDLRNHPVMLEVRGLRTAGWFLVAGAVLNALSMVVFGATTVRSTYSSGWISIGFDLWIGGSLIFGQFGVRNWVMIRAALGALLFGVGAVVGGARIEGVVTVVSCAAILLLVAPGAGRVRIAIGTVSYGLVLLLSIAGLAFASRS
jgi:hypothetical protein